MYLYELYNDQSHSKLKVITIFYVMMLDNNSKVVDGFFFVYLLAHKYLLLVNYKKIIYFLLPQNHFTPLINSVELTSLFILRNY